MQEWLDGAETPAPAKQPRGAGASASLGKRSDVMQDLTQPGFVKRQRSTAGRTERLAEHGVEMPATLNSFDAKPPTPMFGGIPVDLYLTINPPGAAPYDITVHQVFREETVKAFTAGAAVTVRVDPDDPQTVMLWT